MPVVVVNGRRPGPRLFVAAAIHGDEILGVEIIRRLLKVPLSKLAGTLVAVPIVNVYGFLTHTRYLPDRRDLNRCFPGSTTGSLAARLAHVFMKEVVDRCTHGIDLHTAATHRQNLPYVRVCMDEPETAVLARVFGAPVILNAGLLPGSLRKAARKRHIPLLVYEASEPNRFDEVAIRVGVRGVLNVMSHLGMLPLAVKRPSVSPVLAKSSRWIRAPEGGLLRTSARLGSAVQEGDVIGIISDPVGDSDVHVVAPGSGIVVGRTGSPLVNSGDALFHIATSDRPGRAAASIKVMQGELDPLTVTSPSGEPPIR